MVVSNLRNFLLKVAVVDKEGKPCPKMSEIVLRAHLLYENGLPVEQQASGQELLYGKTVVETSQGVATFKLRIASLSSHRDKRRFRVRISAEDPVLLLREAHLTVMTTPMKCVTKLRHKYNKRGIGCGSDDEVAEEEPEIKRPKAGSSDACVDSTDLELLMSQSQQIQQIRDTQSVIVQQLSHIQIQMNHITHTVDTMNASTN